MEKIEFLNFSQALISPEISQGEIHMALKEFLKKFGVTVLLVIEEYFTNAFSKDEDIYGSLKRSFSFRDISNDEFSDDEDDITFCFGHKKRNFWFFQLIFFPSKFYDFLIGWAFSHDYRDVNVIEREKTHLAK